MTQQQSQSLSLDQLKNSIKERTQEITKNPVVEEVVTSAELQEQGEELAQVVETTSPLNNQKEFEEQVEVVEADPVEVIEEEKVTTSKEEEKVEHVSVLRDIDDADPLEAELTKHLAEQSEEGVERKKLYNVIRSAVEGAMNSENKITQQQAQIKDLLAKVTPQSITNAVIREFDPTKPLESNRKIDYVAKANMQAAFPIICMKSGYRAWIAPLTNNEKLEMRNISINGGTSYDITNNLLKLIHRKCVDTSLGRLSYQEFLNKTADEDFDTLMFGLFAASFPKPVEYEIRCPKCGETNTLKIAPNNLIEVLNMEETGPYIQNLLEHWHEGESFTKEHALINSTEDVLLPDSKILVNIGTPTMNKMLKGLNAIRTYEGKFEADLVSMLRSINRILVPDIEALMDGRVEYVELPDQQTFLKVLNEVSGDDLKALRKAIVTRVGRYMIDYRIGKFNCAKCGHEIKGVNIDMTQLLFTSIAQVTSI